MVKDIFEAPKGAYSARRPDNAVVERFIRSFKSETTNHCLYAPREAARQDIIDYIEIFYNSQRLHSYLDYQSPNEFEREVLDAAA